MARLIFGMMQSLDGYIDGPAGDVQLPPPGPILSRHFTDYVRGSDGLLYGRRLYEVMRYWDEDQPGGTRSSMISPKPGVRSRSGLHHGL